MMLNGTLFLRSERRNSLRLVEAGAEQEQLGGQRAYSDESIGAPFPHTIGQCRG